MFGNLFPHIIYKVSQYRTHQGSRPFGQHEYYYDSLEESLYLRLTDNIFLHET